MLEAFAVADIEGRSHSLSPNAKRAQLKDVRDRAYTGDMSLCVAVNVKWRDAVWRGAMM